MSKINLTAPLPHQLTEARVATGEGVWRDCGNVRAMTDEEAILAGERNLGFLDGEEQAAALRLVDPAFARRVHHQAPRQMRRAAMPAFVLTPGQARDVRSFRPLMRIVADPIDAVLADKGYDADAIREELADAKVEAVIPAKANRRNPAPHDRAKYRGRTRIERLFIKLKNWRRIATRYDKTADSYMGFVSSPQLCCGCPLFTEPSNQQNS